MNKLFFAALLTSILLASFSPASESKPIPESFNPRLVNLLLDFFGPYRKAQRQAVDEVAKYLKENVSLDQELGQWEGGTDDYNLFKQGKSIGMIFNHYTPENADGFARYRGAQSLGMLLEESDQLNTFVDYLYRAKKATHPTQSKYLMDKIYSKLNYQFKNNQMTFTVDFMTRGDGCMIYGQLSSKTEARYNDISEQCD